MSTEKRIERIEVRVDEIKDDVSELKADFKIHTKLIEEHVAGDTKIIKEIQPLLNVIPHLTEMTQDYAYKKHRKEKIQDNIKDMSMKLGLVSLILGIVTGVVKFLGVF